MSGNDKLGSKASSRSGKNGVEIHFHSHRHDHDHVPQEFDETDHEHVHIWFSDTTADESYRRHLENRDERRS